MVQTQTQIQQERRETLMSMAQEIIDMLDYIKNYTKIDDETYRAVDHAHGTASYLDNDIENIHDIIVGVAEEINENCNEQNKYECAIKIADLRRHLIIQNGDELLEEEEAKYYNLLNWIYILKENIDYILNNAHIKDKEALDILKEAKDIIQRMIVKTWNVYDEINHTAVMVLENCDEYNRDYFSDKLKNIASQLV